MLSCANINLVSSVINPRGFGFSVTQDGHKIIECYKDLCLELVCDRYLSLLNLPSLPGSWTDWRILSLIPFLVQMPSFYSAITLHKELLEENKTLIKFRQCFTANPRATQCGHALVKLSSHVCHFHVVLIKNLHENYPCKFSFWSSTEVFSRCWCSSWSQVGVAALELRG